jgi:hypothetical protein
MRSRDVPLMSHFGTCLTCGLTSSFSKKLASADWSSARASSNSRASYTFCRNSMFHSEQRSKSTPALIMNQSDATMMSYASSTMSNSDRAWLKTRASASVHSNQ